MLKYLIAFILPFCACHADVHCRHFSDYIKIKESKRFVIKDCLYTTNTVKVLFYDKQNQRYQGFVCSIDETWVFPKFFSEMVVKYSDAMDYDTYCNTFNYPIYEDEYGF